MSPQVLQSRNLGQTLLSTPFRALPPRKPGIRDGACVFGSSEKIYLCKRYTETSVNEKGKGDKKQGEPSDHRAIWAPLKGGGQGRRIRTKNLSLAAGESWSQSCLVEVSHIHRNGPVLVPHYVSHWLGAAQESVALE